VERLAGEISAAYDDDVVLVAVLKGAVPFLADLVRHLRVVPVVDFLAISAYAPETGRVRIVKDLDLDVFGRDVVLVEDIVDTGLTLTYLLRELRGRGARSVEACTLSTSRCGASCRPPSASPVSTSATSSSSATGSTSRAGIATSTGS